MIRIPPTRATVPPSLRAGFPLAAAALAALALVIFYAAAAVQPDVVPLARLPAFFPVALASYRRHNWGPGLIYVTLFASAFLWQATWAAIAGHPQADLSGALVASFVLLAVSSIMRSIAATRHHRETLAETARERGEFLERATSLDQVVMFLCEEALAVTQAQDALLLTRNPVDDQWEARTRAGLTSVRAAHGAGSQPQLLTSWLIERNRETIIDDLLADPRFEGAADFRSALARPLRNPEGTLIAMLALTHPRPGHFLPQDLRSLDALAATAETALGHASAYERSGRVTERVATQLAAIQRTARQVNADLSPNSIASAILACAVEITEADAGAIRVETDRLPPLTLLSAGAADAAAPAEAVAQRLASASGVDRAEVGTGSTLIPDAGSSLAAPIRANSRNFGALLLEKRLPAAFSIQDAQAIAALTSHAAVALENVRLFREVQQLAQFQRDLLATFSHELRAPLANISALAEVALSGGDNKLTPELLELLKTQSRRLANLSQRTLDVERLEVGAWPLEARPLAVGALAREAAQRWQGATPEREITVSGAEQAGWAWGDEDAAGLILDNLLENAIKHSAARAPICVALERRADQVTVAVEDWGELIPVEQRERLFDRFYRRELTASRKTYGVGLGLYIARQLSQAMGGNAWVEPAGEAGNRFAFCLPAMEEVDENPGGRG